MTIGANETSEELEPRLATLGAGLLLTAIDQLAQGKANEIPQDDSKATYASRIQKVDGRLEWDQTAQAIHDRVRGLHPWPHAYTFHDRARYVIHETRPYATINAAADTLPDDLAATAQTAGRRRVAGDDSGGGEGSSARQRGDGVGDRDPAAAGRRTQGRRRARVSRRPSAASRDALQPRRGLVKSPRHRRAGATPAAPAHGNAGDRTHQRRQRESRRCASTTRSSTARRRCPMRSRRCRRR